MTLNEEGEFARLFSLLFVVRRLWDCSTKKDLIFSDINANCSDLLHLERIVIESTRKELESASARDLCSYEIRREKSVPLRFISTHVLWWLLMYFDSW